MNNAGLAIRHKLYDYIRVADDKKLYAIYHLLENEIDQSTEWWKDKAIVVEMEMRYKSLEDGTDKGFRIETLKQSVSKLRKKKYG
jgi:hypothetical protein